MFMRQLYIYLQDGDMWLDYLETFPDYWTQGETEDDLKTHLLDLYKALQGGESWLDGSRFASISN
jgi:predicted RNase H-like HicB family nuclease